MALKQFFYEKKSSANSSAQDKSTPPAHIEMIEDQPPTAVKADNASDPKRTDEAEVNIVYNNEEEEPELHMRTFLALGSICVLLLGQGFAFAGPPAVLPYIGADLGNTVLQAWIPNALILVQGVLGPIICSASDVFQARKQLMIGACLLSLVGSAIAPGATNINRVIGGQCLLGVGLAAIPLSYVVPSEILPRKWRPMAQALTGILSALTAVAGPLTIGAMVRADPHMGWRRYYWLEVGLWAAGALGLFFGYQPPKRHTRLDHLSFWRKLAQLDFVGMVLLIIGLTLFAYGLSVGGGVYAWNSAKTVAPLTVGLVFLVLFGLYEWKGTTTGIMNHELFRGGKGRGRTFVMSSVLIFIEGIISMPYFVFFGVISNALFTQDPFMTAVRILAFNGFFLLSCPIWGMISTKLRRIREPLIVGFFLMTAGLIGMCTLQPGQGTNQLVFGAISGAGFGAILILIVSAVQLSTPHHLIATATALTNSSRSVGSIIFTPSMSTALSNSLLSKIPSYVAKAAATAGLPAASIPAFIGALANNHRDELGGIPGLTPSITLAGQDALQHAWADSLRLISIIAVPFGALGFVLSFFLDDLGDTMTYRVDAPIEELHAKTHRGD